MLLTIDVGNTNIVLGVFDGERLVVDWRIRTERERTHDEMGVLMSALFNQAKVEFSAIDGVIISCVVPPMTRALVKFCRTYLSVEPIFVGPETVTGMPIIYDNPKEVGADRVVNAVAAYQKHRCALVVVDFGTATTFDCVSAKGEYLGGAISPGIIISCEALFQRASKLPRVEISGPPRVAVAKNTIDSMEAGIAFGYAGLVDGVVEAVTREMEDKPKVIATGGLAEVISALTKSVEEVDHMLTLEGLKILYALNRPGA